MIFRNFFIAFALLLLSACSGQNNIDNQPVDISEQFLLATSPWNTHDPSDVLAGRATDLEFKPVITPRQIKRDKNDMWLKLVLQPVEGLNSPRILELPGHLFARVDVWFERVNGQIITLHSGSSYPYKDRVIKHAGIVFPIPSTSSEPIKVVIKYQTGTPVNFAALIWHEDAWNNYLFNLRGWYGFFFGAVLILCFYNFFLAFTLKDKSYLYYVGYILSLAGVVVLYSGLAEEYLWPLGKTHTYILMVSGFGIFFGVGFVNSFLRIRERIPILFWVSSVVTVMALVFGISHALKIHFVPYQLRGTLMHALLLLGCFYFIGVSTVSYLMGIKQSRFLALSMLALLSGLVIYLLYTYGWIKYNLYLIHALEVGSLIEGVLLSLALSDRINLLSQEKDRAEKEALDSQREFSKRLLKAQEADREKFSNTMHDSIGHGMLVLKQNLQRISSAASSDENPELGGYLGQVQEQAGYCSEILDDIRRMSHDLHPHLLTRLGLKTAIESTLDRAFSKLGIEWQADIVDISGMLDSDREIIIYRVIQECINNILKHANASEVVLSLGVYSGVVNVNIKDDGDGFNVNKTTQNSLGLNEMKDRLTLFGGWFEIASEEGSGTHVKFGLPSG